MDSDDKSIVCIVITVAFCFCLFIMSMCVAQQISNRTEAERAVKIRQIEADFATKCIESGQKAVHGQCV